jgi:carbonic anhydrase/acetyltransferase-like protein (isoleucine patch superfamily)
MDNIKPKKEKQPRIDENAYVNPYAKVIGDVMIQAGASLWPDVIIRADDDCVEIGKNAAILDRSFVEAPQGHPVNIGENVIVSHGAKLHGCDIDNNVLIGISAKILVGAKIGAGSVIAAGAVVPPNTEIPPRSKVVGAPGKVVGEVTEEELGEIRQKHSEIIKKAREYGKWYVVKNL